VSDEVQVLAQISNVFDERLAALHETFNQELDKKVTEQSRLAVNQLKTQIKGAPGQFGRSMLGSVCRAVRETMVENAAQMKQELTDQFRAELEALKVELLRLMASMRQARPKRGPFKISHDDGTVSWVEETNK
jgi:hypothetical protein